MGWPRLAVIADFVLAIAVVVVASPLWFLPRRLAIAIARIGGAIGFVVWGEARRAGIINLKRAFPELSLVQARRTTARVFMNMGSSIAEGIQGSRRAAGVELVHEDSAL